MDIQQIKTQTQQPTLSFNRQMAEDGVTKTDWLYHWDNEKRIRVVAHQDVIEKIKTTPEMKELALKKEVVLAHKSASGSEVPEYTRFVIITPNNIEFSI